MLRELLERKGYEVREESDSESAIRTLETEPPEVMILDIYMPGLTGVAALPAIRVTAPSVKIIVVGGMASLEVAQLALARGAFDFLEKPLNLASLTRAIDAAVAMRRLGV